MWLVGHPPGCDVSFEAVGVREAQVVGVAEARKRRSSVSANSRRVAASAARHSIRPLRHTAARARDARSSSGSRGVGRLWGATDGQASNACRTSDAAPTER